ncbi:AAA ATPase midasin, partial [Coemansia sp. RSA 25]
MRRLAKWAAAPAHASVGATLDGLAALLLAEGADLAFALPGDGGASETGWADGHFTLAVATALRPLLVDLAARWAAADAPVAVFRLLGDHMTGPQAHVAVAYAAGCLAPTVPQLRGAAMRFFAATPASLAQLALDAGGGEGDDAATARVLAVAWRLLRRMPEAASDVAAWDWATPLTVLMGGAARGALVRLLALECLALAQALSDGARAQLQRSLRVDARVAGVARAWLVHGACAFDAHAAALMVAAANGAARCPAGAANGAWVGPAQLSAGVASIGGVLLDAPGAGPADGLVVTPTVARNMHGVALAAARGAPVLLLGAAGAGKTALVEWLARRTGRSLVAVHVSSGMDAKALLGSYVTTQKAGDFEWRAGVLAEAVARGQWVLVEDVDLAPADVVQTLAPLLEAQTLFVPSRGERIRAHAHFRLFATLSPRWRARAAAVDGLLRCSAWTRVEIGAEISELPLIVAGVFASLAARADALAQAFARVGEIVGADSLSTRDLLKWCRRLDAFGEAGDTAGFLAFREAVDAFTMREADYARWRALIVRVGAVFGVARVRVD